MENKTLISAHRAYRKGLWQVRIWPLIVVIIGIGALTYAKIRFALPVEWALVILGILCLICFIWSLRRIGTWKQWMAANTINPKTAIELAKASFLKNAWKEKMAIWGSQAKLQYRADFDERMSTVRQEYMKDAAKRYANQRPVSVHHGFSNLFWLLLFEMVVLTGFIFLFMNQGDAIVRIISILVFIISFVAMMYTMKTIWKRNQTVIEISIHGITIEGKHYGWIELENVDIVRGDTLIYQKHKGPEISLKLENLSLTADYLDELILYYRTAKTTDGLK